MPKIKYTLIPLILSGIFFLNGCNCTNGTGEIKTELRKLDIFTDLEIDVPGKIFLTQSNEYFIKIKADENIIPLIESRIKRKALIIEFSECVKNYEKIEIYISSRVYEEITILGSASLECENQLSAEDMEIDCTGSGKIEFDLHVNELETKITGSGNINFRGKANRHDLKQTGSGSVNAKNLKTKRTDVKNTGSGNCKIHATKEMNGTVTGSGNLTYSGNPKSVSTDITGSGTIKTK